MQLAGASTFTAFLLDDNDDGPGAKDALEMYLAVAASALHEVDKFCPEMAHVLQEVIDFLVSDTRIQPGELDNARAMEAEALKELETVQTKL